MRLLRFFAVSAIVASVLLLAGPAHADCSGPTITFSPSPVARGDTLTITGEAFGDACYDTGPPPSGEGVLGKPIGDLRILLAQGSEQHLVATGAADAEYGFTVDVVVPPELAPGTATVVVQAASGLHPWFPNGEELSVSAADPVAGSSSRAPVEFGPRAEIETAGSTSGDPSEVTSEETTDETSGDPSDDAVSWPAVIALTVVLIVALLAMAVWRRRLQSTLPRR